jgi:tetratricopeptide (TPR) repeat protein
VARPTGQASGVPIPRQRGRTPRGTGAKEANPDLDTVRRSFAQAVGYYQKALRIDRQYARAWYGIAETRFLQVGLSCQPDRTNRPLLAQVVRDLEQGQRATHRPTLANLDAKIAFGLGRAQICMTLAGVADRRAQAQEQLNIAIRAFQQNPSGDPSTPDARAYDLRAVEDYKQAIALSADRPQRQPVFYDNLADIYNRLHLPRDAEEARNKARSLKATGHTAYG